MPNSICTRPDIHPNIESNPTGTKLDSTHTQSEQATVHNPKHTRSKLHPNRTRTRPEHGWTKIDRNTNFTRTEHEPDLSIVDPKLTQTKLGPNLYLLRLIRLPSLAEPVVTWVQLIFFNHAES